MGVKPLRITRKFALRKFIELLLTLFIVTVISFLLMQLSPVDPAEAYARRTFSVYGEEQIDALREQMGLNQPLIVQYGKWVANALHLDFGTSFFNGRPVLAEVSGAIKITLSIVLLAACIEAVGILVFGSLCYWTRNNFLGKVFNALCIAGVSLPPFFFASSFLDIFAVQFRLISVAGNKGIMKYLPAALCLSICTIAFYSQLLAKRIEGEMNEDYATYARCRGLSESRILFYHALPHSLAGLLPSFMQMVGISLAGSAIVERIFSLPGLGYTIIDSVLYRDSPMIHATILFLAFFLAVCNILADLLQRLFQENQSVQERGKR